MLDVTQSLCLNAYGNEVKDLHKSLIKLGYHIPEHERKEEIFGVGTRDALLNFQAKKDLRRTGKLDDQTREALARAVAAAENDKHRVEGRLLFDHGQPASDVDLRLYDIFISGKETRLTETKTDGRGFYALTYDPKGKTANLEVRAVDAQGKEVSLSRTKFSADQHEVLHLVAPETIRPLAPEFERISADLEEHLDGLDRLADAKESAEQPDLILLHKATGWDARLIALAAMAVQRSAETKIAR